MNKKKILDLFNNDGFVVLKDFFKKDKLTKLEDSIKALVNHHLSIHNLNKDKFTTDEALIELNNIRKNKKKFDSIQVIYNTIRKLPEVFNLVTDKKLIQIINELNGISDYDNNGSPYIWEAFCRIDPPEDSTYSLKWHQESYFTLPNSNSVQLWFPIINNILEKNNGAMCALEKSHNCGEIAHSIVRHNENYISESILPPKLKKLNLKEKKFELNRGDILLFHEHLIHRTINNNGKKVRFTVVANYANPYLNKFKFMSENEVVFFHKSRTENSNQFLDYINKFSKKGGVNDYSSIKN